MDWPGADGVAPSWPSLTPMPPPDPKVSVIIPCFNLGEYLDEAVDSVLRQTYRDLEILVVDDGSTDPSTRRLLDDYRRDKTRVFRRPHRGVTHARNFGIGVATGEYLCFLDADDRLTARCLERTTERLLGDPSLSFVSFWVRLFGDENWEWKPVRCDLLGLLCECTVATSAVVRRAAVEAVGGFDPTMEVGHEDWDLWLTLVERGLRGAILPEVLFEYRRRATSRSAAADQIDAYVRLFADRVRKHDAGYRALLLEAVTEQEAHLGRLLHAIRAPEPERSDVRATRGPTREVVVERAERPVSGLSLVVPGPLLPERSREIRDALAQATARPTELVVWDRPSPDVEVFSAEERNAAVAATAYDYLLFAGAESFPDRDFVAAACAALDRDRDVMFAAAEPWAPRRDGDLPWLAEPARLLSRPWFVQVPTVFRRALFNELKGFDSALGAVSDLDFWLRAAERHTGHLVEHAAAWAADPAGAPGSSDGVRALAGAFLARHRATIETHRVAVLSGKERVVQQLLGRVRDRAVSLAPTPDRTGPGAPSPRRGVGAAAGEARARVGVILTYHRIAEPSSDPHGLALPPAVFQEHLRRLKGAFQLLELSTLVSAAREDRIPSRAVAITLDDGTIDHLDAASPLLCEEQAPATFFVSDAAFDGPFAYWWDTLADLLVTTTALPPVLRLDPLPPLSTITEEDRLTAMRAVHGHLLRKSFEDQVGCLARLTDWRGGRPAPRSGHRLLGLAELRQLGARPGHTLGAHSRRHLFLPAQPREAQEQEIADHKRALEARLGAPVTLFAYPFGAVSGETAALVRQAGFAAAVTTERRGIVAHDDPYWLPRVEAPRDPQALVDCLETLFGGPSLTAFKEPRDPAARI
jgi:GT2 family glycosyltransferase/peptidoglycan/xylan/chitin deacetylase (PgdA/CDA1 family)